MGNEIKFQIGKIRCLQKSNVHFWTHCNDIFGKKSTIPKQKDYIRFTIKKFKAKLENQRIRSFLQKTILELTESVNQMLF